MPITRRTVLKGGVAAVAVVGTGTFAGLYLGKPAPGAQILTAAELRVVEAAAEALFPKGAFPINGVEAGVAEGVDEIVVTIMDEVRATGFRYVLRTLEYGTLASRGGRFSSLSVEERTDVLNHWATADVLLRRVALDSLRVVLSMAYFAHPEVIAAMGWRETCGGGQS